MRVFAPFALFVLLGVACAASNSNEDSSGGPAGPSAGAPPNDDGLPTAIEFEDIPPLVTREQVTLNVRLLPRGVYSVRFDLPSTDGDPLDAVLDRSSATTDEQGLASVVLTAPSSAASFEVRASVGSRSASLSLEVRAGGVASLRVEPSYQPGYPTALRNITTWIATAHVGKSCADVAGAPFADGELKAPPAAKTEAPLFDEVPAGKPLAVTLRSGHFVGGCTSVEMLPPGSPARPEVVKVAVYNRPIDLSASNLAFSLDLPVHEDAWSATLAGAAERVLAGIAGTSDDDVDALLDAMRGLKPNAAQAFTTARDAEDWDAALRARWGQTASTKLRDRVSGWLAAGRQSFASAAHAFTGLLAPLADSEGSDAKGKATLTLLRVAGLDAKTAGFVTDGVVSWSASSDDNVVLGTDLYFSGSQLAEALGDAARSASDSSVVSAGQSLSDALDCAGIGSELAALGADVTQAYAGCDAACLQSACTDALAAMWKRGGAVDGSAFSRLSLSATGRAYVGDAAELTGLTGNWIGELTDAAGVPTTGGTLTAAVPTDGK